LFLSPVFKIEKVEIFVPKNVQETEIRSFINFEFEKPFLHFFKKNTFFLVKSKNIERDILKKYPLIAQVKINKKFPNAIFLNITDREAVGVCCLKRNKCFLVDKNGIAFKDYQQQNDGLILSLPLIILKNKSQINIGSQVIQEEFLKQIITIEKYLANNDVKISQFEFDHNNNLTVNLKGGGKIYFSLVGDEKLNLALTKLSLLLDEILKSEDIKNLDYIDLRFSKVFYRLKD